RNHHVAFGGFRKHRPGRRSARPKNMYPMRREIENVPSPPSRYAASKGMEHANVTKARMTIALIGPRPTRCELVRSAASGLATSANPRLLATDLQDSFPALIQRSGAAGPPGDLSKNNVQPPNDARPTVGLGMHVLRPPPVHHVLKERLHPVDLA